MKAASTLPPIWLNEFKGGKMKQKYVLTKNGETETLTISEYTEVEKNTFSLICEESHDGAEIRAAIAEGTEKLISTFRTHNMYPRVKYAEQMAKGIVELYRAPELKKKEFVFDDRDAFRRTVTGETAFFDVIETDGVSRDTLMIDEDDEGIEGMEDETYFDESDSDVSNEDE